MLGHRSLEYIRLDDLTPFQSNARTHSRKQIRQIAESIRRFGFTSPVLVDGHNTILSRAGEEALTRRDRRLSRDEQGNVV